MCVSKLSAALASTVMSHMLFVPLSVTVIAVSLAANENTGSSPVPSKVMSRMLFLFLSVKAKNDVLPLVSLAFTVNSTVTTEDSLSVISRMA